MKFYNTKIATRTVSMEDAIAKAQSKPKLRSLEEMLADIDAKNKAVKTAQAMETEEVETAASHSVQHDEPEPPEEVHQEVQQAEQLVHDGKAKDMQEAMEMVEAAEHEAQPVTSPATSATPAPKMASSGMQLKFAKSMDFRQEPKNVLAMWKGHGSLEKCIVNVAGTTSDPKIYCGLLCEASKLAEQELRKASKQASQKSGKPKTGQWKKFAKMTAEEKAWYRDYLKNLYGEGYVEALLADY